MTEPLLARRGTFERYALFRICYATLQYCYRAIELSRSAWALRIRYHRQPGVITTGSVGLEKGEFQTDSFRPRVCKNAFANTRYDAWSAASVLNNYLRVALTPSGYWVSETIAQIDFDLETSPFLRYPVYHATPGSGSMRYRSFSKKVS